MRISARFLAILLPVLMAATAAADAPGPTKIVQCQTIDQPGSYVLTKNLTATGDCLVLAANYVSIDLAGFLISGSGTGVGAGDGITSTQVVNGILIHDGSIIGFETGIHLCEGAGTDNSANNVTVLRMRLHENTNGMRICGSGAIVKDTNASANVNLGILIDGDRSVVSGNTANANGGIGIILGTGGSGGSTVIGNTADANNHQGFVVGPGSTFMNNTARGNGGGGLDVTCPSNVLGNTLTANGAIGTNNIRTSGLGCNLEHNVIAP